jgi:hypothetical protein
MTSSFCKERKGLISRKGAKTAKGISSSLRPLRLCVSLFDLLLQGFQGRSDEG